MIIKPVQTDIIKPGEIDLFSLLDKYLITLDNYSVVAITSKIISLCENNVIAIDSINKEELIKQQANLYLPAKFSKYHHHFTIINNTIVGSSGIDESNSNGHYVLWPKNPQKTANDIREYLKKRFKIDRVGVILTDSTSFPLRRGSQGISIAHSGFSALKNYIGTPDLFGKLFDVSKANISGGLAAAAVLEMGEGQERIPIVVISEIPNIEFKNSNPSKEELAQINLSLEDDLFAPFLTSVKWEHGSKNTH